MLPYGPEYGKSLPSRCPTIEPNRVNEDKMQILPRKISGGPQLGIGRFVLAEIGLHAALSADVLTTNERKLSFWSCPFELFDEATCVYSQGSLHFSHYIRRWTLRYLIVHLVQIQSPATASHAMFSVFLRRQVHVSKSIRITWWELVSGAPNSRDRMSSCATLACLTEKAPVLKPKS